VETHLTIPHKLPAVARSRYRVPAPFVMVVPLPPEFPREVNVGAKVWVNFVLSLDQSRARLRLEHEGAPLIDLSGPRTRIGTAPAG
jgi:hypothetical protein